MDLCRLAGLTQCGLCCEIMRDDGTMMRTVELLEKAKEWGLKVPNQHPAPPGHQRKYVAGTAQILRTGGGIGTFAAPAPSCPPGSESSKSMAT